MGDAGKKKLAKRRTAFVKKWADVIQGEGEGRRIIRPPGVQLFEFFTGRQANRKCGKWRKLLCLSDIITAPQH